MLKKLISFVVICVIFEIRVANAGNDKLLEPLHFKEYNYVGIKIGIVQPTSLRSNTGLDTANPTYITGFNIGRKFAEIISADIEYMYRGKNTAQYDTPNQMEYEPTSWSMQSDAIMTNLTVDLMTNFRVIPYLRGGVGIATNKAYTYTSFEEENGLGDNIYYPGKTVKNLAWQIGCGASFDTSSMLSTEIEYMFVNRGRIETQAYYTDSDNKINSASPIRSKLLDHIVTVGLKVKF